MGLWRESGLGPRWCRSAASPAAAALAVLALGACLQPARGLRAVVEPDPIETYIVVPELKFAFCFIPKNACTQFNKLMNFLNGFNEHLGEVCSSADPNFVSRWKRFRRFTRKDFDSIMAGDVAGWTRAVFLRDPLERLVSAWRSKCSYPRECGGCPGAENLHKCEKWKQKGNCLPSFDNVVTKHLSSTNNVHFLPQVNFCGGFGPANISQKFDFVGHLSGDYESNSREVRSLLTRVFQRNPLVAQHVLERLPAVRGSEATRRYNGSLDAAASIAAAELTQTFFMPDKLADAAEPYFAGLDNTQEGPVSVADRYFPVTGPAADDGHINGVRRANNVSAYYAAPGVLSSARDFYSEDFKLPGLQMPGWAAQ